MTLSPHPPAKKLIRTGAATTALALAALVFLPGCLDDSASRPRRGPATSGGGQSGLFESVADNINQLEDFDTAQILKQTCDRLNQWYQQEHPEIAWQPDPLLDTLSDELRASPGVETIDQVKFQTPDDAWFLQQGVWMRDISSGARGDQFQDLAIAERLFDWTIRNIRLEPDRPAGAPYLNRHRPFETLLYGSGTAVERAWVFTLLARQQGLDVVMLGLADENGGNVRPWLPALVLDDNLYLFDCRLGLPVPGPEPGSVATLSDVVADDKLLRKLDLDDAPYPVTADDLKHVVAYVEGSPASLSKRMALVESRLVGQHRMKLLSPGSALAERVAKLPHVAEVKLWPLPFEVYQWKTELTPEQVQEAGRELIVYQLVPTLKVGRAKHFKGELEGEKGAKTNYLNSRPPDSLLDDYKLPPALAEKVPPSRRAEVEAAHILWLREGKQNASYWLGLIFFEEDDYPNAIDFLDKRTLQTENNPWADAARYNLARTYEAQGDLARAIELYEANPAAPQSHGNRLRARRLREQLEPKADPAKDEPADAEPSDLEPAEADSEPADKEPAEEAPTESEPEAEKPAEPADE